MSLLLQIPCENCVDNLTTKKYLKIVNFKRSIHRKMWQKTAINLQFWESFLTVSMSWDLKGTIFSLNVSSSTLAADSTSVSTSERRGKYRFYWDGRRIYYLENPQLIENPNPNLILIIIFILTTINRGLSKTVMYMIFKIHG